MVSDFRFVCLTDDPTDLVEGIEPIELPRTDLEYCWNKLLLFEKQIGDLSGTALFFDLDVVITGNIDDLFNYRPDESFMGVLDWNRMNNPQYNASVMRYELGKHSYIINEFYERCKAGSLVKKREWDAYLKSNDKVVYFDESGFRYGGDQEWTSKQVYPQHDLKSHTFQDGWILSYKAHGRGSLPQGCKVMVFHGDPKPHEVNLDYVKEHWK
jgi:hypothetical protein